MLNLYLHGYQEKDTGMLSLSVTSSAVIFVVRYCKLKNYRVFLVKDKKFAENDTDFVSIPECNICDCLLLMSLDSNDLPSDIASCKMPVVKGDSDNLIRCGLCSSARYIVLQADKVSPTDHLDQIMGFRGGTLKSCAEVSSWTKLCEMGIPEATHNVRVCLKNGGVSEKLKVPPELQRLENYLNTPVLHHNDNKKKQEILTYLRKTFTEDALRSSLECDTSSGDIQQTIMKIIQQDISREHCVTKFQILRHFDKINTVNPEKKRRRKKHTGSRNQRLAALRKERINCVQKSEENHSEIVNGIDGNEVGHLSPQNCDSSSSAQVDTRKNADHQSNSILEVQNGHIENEISRTRLTDSDISKITNDTEALSVSDNTTLHGDAISDQSEFLSHIVHFIRSLSPADIYLDHKYVEGKDLTLADLLLFVFIHFYMESICSAGYSINNSCPKLLGWYIHMTCLPRVQATAQDCGITFPSLPSNSTSVQELTSSTLLDSNGLAEEVELSHYTKGRCRALKPDVANAISKVKIANIQPVIGEHPCAPDIHLPWSTFPKQVYPFEGSESRVRSKCEQLENLVTAVVKIAQAGQVIVDFCSGSGHLGIVIAYLLPHCQVYLIENKEESVMRAKHRVDILALKNVTLFQCNLDYFTGQFDVGVCLHGCGVATDMVLHQCLDNRAAFVVCPCCYGKVQNTHSITYPRSEVFRQAQLTAKEYIVLGHAADQTEVGIELEQQGKYCSNLVDTDRGMLFQQYGYSVTLCSLQPLTCTTKNNLLIGEILQ